MEELVHASVSADFLEMADELQRSGYKDAAAVIAGSTLEEHLRKLAIKNRIAVEKSDGSPMKADRLNADLAKVPVYNKLIQKSVTAWLGLRNSAAHGEYGAYDDGQVANLIPRRARIRGSASGLSPAGDAHLALPARPADDPVAEPHLPRVVLLTKRI